MLDINQVRFQIEPWLEDNPRSNTVPCTYWRKFGNTLNKGRLNSRHDPFDIMIAWQDNKIVTFSQKISKGVKEYRVAGDDTLEFPDGLFLTRPKTKALIP